MRRGYKEALGRTVESAPAPKELSRRSERQDSATFDDEVADAGVPAVVRQHGEARVGNRLGDLVRGGAVAARSADVGAKAFKHSVDRVCRVRERSQRLGAGAVEDDGDVVTGVFELFGGAEGAVDRSVVVNELGEDSVGTRLISAADALFYAEGIHAVGIDRVLGEAGVAKTSLYNHFASRTIS